VRGKRGVNKRVYGGKGGEKGTFGEGGMFGRKKKRVFKKRGGGGEGCMDMIDLAEDRDRWQALLCVVVSLHAP